MFTIDDDIPVPKFRSLGKYPFGSMNVGQSFSAPENSAAKVRAALASYVKKSAASAERRQYITRIVTEKGERVLRCWRVA